MRRWGIGWRAALHGLPSVVVVVVPTAGWHALAGANPGEASRSSLRDTLRREEAKAPGRPRRRRYAASNTRGRADRAEEILAMMKASTDRTAAFQKLHPRDQLDLMRLLHRRRARATAKASRPPLPRYWSSAFERRYYFKEEDVDEESTLGTGPGGQATNRRKQTILLRHKPTNMVIRVSKFTSLHINRRVAREMLNLRLEEHLLGSASQLGREKLRIARRSYESQRELRRLERQGAALRAQASQRRDVFAVLTGASPLPKAMVHQMGGDFATSSRPTYLHDLLNTKCHLWWPVLSRCVAAAARESPPLAPPSSPGSSAAAAVPELLHYVFPVACPSATADHEAFHREQLAKCRSSATVVERVKAAMRCFVEVFGLRLCEAHDAVSPAAGAASAAAGADLKKRVRLVLRPDGANWVEYRARMVRSECELTAVAAVCLPHVYRSLRDMGCGEEAGALRQFLQREHRRQSRAPRTGDAREPRTWARQGLELLARSGATPTAEAVAADAVPRPACGGGDASEGLPGGGGGGPATGAG